MISLVSCLLVLTGKTNMYDMMSTFKNVTWLYVNATAPRLQ